MAPQVEKEGDICMNDNLLYVLPFYPPLENRYFDFHFNFKKTPSVNEYKIFTLTLNHMYFALTISIRYMKR